MVAPTAILLTAGPVASKVPTKSHPKTAPSPNMFESKDWTEAVSCRGVHQLQADKTYRRSGSGRRGLPNEELVIARRRDRDGAPDELGRCVAILAHNESLTSTWSHDPYCVEELRVKLG